MTAVRAYSLSTSQTMLMEIQALAAASPSPCLTNFSSLVDKLDDVNPQDSEVPRAAKELKVDAETQTELPLLAYQGGCCECPEDSDSDLNHSASLSLHPSSSEENDSSQNFISSSLGSMDTGCSSGVHLSNQSWKSISSCREKVTCISPTVSRCPGSEISPCVMESPISEPCEDRSEAAILKPDSQQSISQLSRCNASALIHSTREFVSRPQSDCSLNQAPPCDSMLHDADAEAAAALLDVIWTARWMGGAYEGLRLPGPCPPQQGQRLQERGTRCKGGLFALWGTFVSFISASKIEVS